MTRVLLVGLMAAGKSIVSQAISAASGWPALDNDVLLERSTGLTAVQLLETRGPHALRSAESDVLTLTLSMPGPLVAGVPAGVVLDEGDRMRLSAGGHVVYLRTPVSLLVRRVSGRDHRPFLDGDVTGALRAMSEQRDPLYVEVAHQVLEMQFLTPVQAARQVLAALRD
ncbi:MAG: serine transporter [Frankiales bacterium]|nr:serine transporter [Frankiales bacterium]